MEAKHAQNLPEGPMGNGCCLHLGSPAGSGMRKRVDAPWTYCGETRRQPLTPSSDFQNWFLVTADNWMLRAGLYMDLIQGWMCGQPPANRKVMLASRVHKQFPDARQTKTKMGLLRSFQD